MAADPDDESVERGVREAFVAAARQLATGEARDEALAVFEPARRVLLIERRARLRPLGRVWRLGVLLLQADGTVHATGRVTRSAPPGHGAYIASSIEARREVRAAAYRGPFEPGEVINLDASSIDLDPAALRVAEGPLFLVGDRPLVRWSVSAGDDAARDLAPYLTERVDLLLHPPQGAT